MIQKPEDYNKYNRLCGVSTTDKTLDVAEFNFISAVCSETGSPAVPHATRE